MTDQQLRLILSLFVGYLIGTFLFYGVVLPWLNKRYPRWYMKRFPWEKKHR
jgi:hypothetical protein